MKVKKLRLLLIKILMKYGLNYNHSIITSNALINAELVGAHSHGLSRLKMYCERISKKVINPKPKIKIKKVSTSISHVDASLDSFIFQITGRTREIDRFINLMASVGLTEVSRTGVVAIARGTEKM